MSLWGIDKLIEVVSQVGREIMSDWKNGLRVIDSSYGKIRDLCYHYTLKYYEIQKCWLEFKKQYLVIWKFCKRMLLKPWLEKNI